MTSAVLPTGDQWEIRYQAPNALHAACITQTGANLRSYTIDSRPLVHGFGAHEPCPAYRGATLLPWPNRVGDGRYEFGGQERQLALTEPGRLNATQGLVHWQDWHLVRREEHEVVVATTLRPQPGWDWILRCRITFSLGVDGLRVTPWVRNESETEAPFGYGAHPYLTCGEEHIDELEMRLPAASSLMVDETRLLPVRGSLADSVAPVVPDADLRDGPALADLVLDTAYTELAADDDGVWRAQLWHPGTGRTTTLWAPLADFGWAQVFTGDELPEPLNRRSGVAVEPMTCGPDALRTGAGLITLAPGQEWSATWGVTGS